MFYDNLKDVIERFHIEPQNIWNMDESALKTVQKPTAVIAKRGVRNLGAMTSAERGVLVTHALAVSAGGVCLPPFYIFPRVKFLYCGCWFRRRRCCQYFGLDDERAVLKMFAPLRKICSLNTGNVGTVDLGQSWVPFVDCEYYFPFGNVPIPNWVAERPRPGIRRRSSWIF